MLEVIFTKLATICISIGLDRAGNWLNKKFDKKKEISIDDVKRLTKVLFVDDEDFSSKISVIRNAGWNINQIGEITNLDSEEIKNADIIFMDYYGVGKILTPKEQGIGLLKCIRKKYPEKFIVFFSGYAGVIPGHEVHSIANAWIPKHEDTFVYIDQIEEAAIKLYESKHK